MKNTFAAGKPVCPVGESSCDVIDELVYLRDQYEQVQTEAHTDALTGLHNFRHFEQALNQEMERVRRSHLPLALILADVDYFKRFNDTHGHEAGNQALVEVARVINEQIRQLDIACRFGGEEFAVLLPATDAAQALAVAERIRRVVEAETLQTDVEVTLSLGVAVYSALMHISGREFVSTADKMLYASKHRGRNCVTGPDIEPSVSEQSVTPEEKSALFGLFGGADQDLSP